MTAFDLGGGKQIVIGKDRIQIWANRGCLGTELSAEQMQEIGLTLWLLGRKAKRGNANLQERSDKL